MVGVCGIVCLDLNVAAWRNKLRVKTMANDFQYLMLEFPEGRKFAFTLGGEIIESGEMIEVLWPDGNIEEYSIDIWYEEIGDETRFGAKICPKIHGHAVKVDVAYSTLMIRRKITQSTPIISIPRMGRWVLFGG